MPCLFYSSSLYNVSYLCRSDDYSAALGLIDGWIRSEAGMPKESVAELDSFFETYSSEEPSQVLVEGQVWGALEGDRQLCNDYRIVTAAR